MNRTTVTAATGLTALVTGLAVVAATANALPGDAPAPCTGYNPDLSCERTPSGAYGTSTTQPATVSIQCAHLDAEAAQPAPDAVIGRCSGRPTSFPRPCAA